MAQKNKHLPTKGVRLNKNKHKKSKWMTNGILKSIKKKINYTKN